jgi:hypothetical protein
VKGAESAAHGAVKVIVIAAGQASRCPDPRRVQYVGHRKPLCPATRIRRRLATAISHGPAALCDRSLITSYDVSRFGAFHLSLFTFHPAPPLRLGVRFLYSCLLSSYSRLRIEVIALAMMTQPIPAICRRVRCWARMAKPSTAEMAGSILIKIPKARVLILRSAISSSA